MLTKQDKQELREYARRNKYRYTVVYTRDGKVFIETVRHALPLRGRNFYKIQKDLRHEVESYFKGELHYILKGHPDIPQRRHLPSWEDIKA